RGCEGARGFQVGRQLGQPDSQLRARSIADQGLAHRRRNRQYDRGTRRCARRLHASQPQAGIMSDQEEPPIDENHLIAERRAKLAKLRERGNPFPNDFRRNALAGDLLTAYGEKSAEGLDAAPIRVAVAGRMRAKRVMGKASFAKLVDSSGSIQVFLQQQALGLVYDEFKGWDVGDVIGAEGTLFRTKTGELSVRAERLVLLTKSLRPLPDKWHGIADTEL